MKDQQTIDARKLCWSIVLGYHIVRKSGKYDFRVEKWRSYSSLDLDPSEMISYWHPIMWKHLS